MKKYSVKLKKNNRRTKMNKSKSKRGIRHTLIENVVIKQGELPPQNQKTRILLKNCMI